MSGEVHFHRKVVVSLNLGPLPTYLLCVFFFGGVQLILNRGSTKCWSAARAALLAALLLSLALLMEIRLSSVDSTAATLADSC